MAAELDTFKTFMECIINLPIVRDRINKLAHDRDSYNFDVTVHVVIGRDLYDLWESLKAVNPEKAGYIDFLETRMDTYKLKLEIEDNLPPGSLQIRYSHEMQFPMSMETYIGKS